MFLYHIRPFGILLETNAILIAACFLFDSFWESLIYAVVFGFTRAIFSGANGLIEIPILLVLALVIQLFKYIALVDRKSIRVYAIVFGIMYPLLEWFFRTVFFDGIRFWFLIKSILILSLTYYIVFPIFIKQKREKNDFFIR